MSHQARGSQPIPNYQDGEYIATAGGETIVPIQGPGATGTSHRLRRSASVEHNPENFSEKPPTGTTRSQVPAPTFARNDNFFNEKITLPRVAMNEREHITSEDYDNEDRGSLDNEEQSYDRTVKYSQGRSGSLPPRRFQDRSSYFDWSSSAPRSQYFESSAYAKEGGGQLANAPWTELEHQRQLQQRAEADQQFSKQTTHQTMERSHNESHERGQHYYGGHHRRERHSGEGGRGGYAYEEWHDGDGAVAPYYRPEHTSTLRGASSSKHQHRQAAAHNQASHQASAQQHQAAAANAGGGSSYHYHHRYGGASGASGAVGTAGGGHRYGHSQSYGYRSGGAAGSGGYYKERKYRRINCCCFPCVWPPWGIEETHPPRQMYYSKPPPHL